MTIAHLKKRMDVRFKTLDRRLNRRFGSVDARFDSIDAHLDRMEARSDARFDSIGDKLDALFATSRTHKITTRRS